jgi:opacity protein-like surface antigen
MKNHYQYLLVVAATLSIATSAQAQEVSTKAADLIANASSSQINNQQTESEQLQNSLAQNFEVTDSNQPEKNYLYISGSVGAGFPSDIKGTEKSSNVSANFGLDTAFQGTIATGYQWDQARAEIELGYGSFGVNKIKSPGFSEKASGDISATTLMLNGYWDIKTGSKFRPYIGAGIGLGFPSSSQIKVAGTSIVPSGSGTALALQGKAGIQYEVAKKGNVFVEVKYQNVGGFSAGSGTDKVDYGSTDSFGVGIGYRQGF